MMLLRTLLFFAATPAIVASRFNCTDMRVPPMAKTVDKLHPGHVEFVIASGDSITAAFAARGSLLEARDISWSAGVGSSDSLTLPYLLSQYTKSPVQGASEKAVVPIPPLPHGDYHKKTDLLNVAQSSGAVHRNSLVEQWALLEKAVQKYKTFKQGWKVLTVWMMANDVCGECKRPSKQGYIDSYVAGYNAFLTNVTSTMTNVYINLVSTLQLSQIHRLQQSKLTCKIEHGLILSECGCIDRGNATELAQMDANTDRLNRELHYLAGNWTAKMKAGGRTDIAVQTQPFMEGVGKTLDISFLNGLDCFHPSAKAHEDLAIGLWNSMLCTGDRKNRCNLPFTPANMPVTCPTEDSVFYVGDDVIPNPLQVTRRAHAGAGAKSERAKNTVTALERR